MFQFRTFKSPKQRLFFGLFLLLPVTYPAYSMDEVEQARTLLRKMVTANRDLDYQGTFTYEYAGNLKAMRITHVVKDGLEYEKLVYLNGPKREITRGGVSTECRNSGDDFLAGLPVPSQLGGDLESNYELLLRGEDRVADREVRVIHVVPRDAMRYGYILALDKDTGLLLQSLLVGGNRRVMERFQYVDIHFDPDVEAAVGQIGATNSSHECATDMAEQLGWQVNWLPDGFRLLHSSREGDKTTFVYSDGLSFVSVFISSEDTPSFPPIQAQRGATVAQIARLTHNGREYAVCVVGEVPPETAERIAQFVSPR